MDSKNPQSNDSQAVSRSRRQFLRRAAALGGGLVAWPRAADARGARPEGSAQVRSGTFVTSDGVGLHYLEAGRGKPLVLIPGWSQTAAMYWPQLQALSRHHRVIALDMRGHGDSDKPAGGYRIARLAKDLHEFLEKMDGGNITVAGHSMGCSVIWSLWEQFGRSRVDRLILIDQAPAVTAWPGWSEDERAEAGTLFTPQSLYDTAAGLAGPDGVRVSEGLVRGLFSSSFPEDALAEVIEQNLKFPRAAAARLLVDHCGQDWRDLIPTLDVPTLVVGGEVSIFHPRSQQWIARQIPGAQLSIFSASEGGSHFMFLENPDKFNQLVLDFLG
ncbi:MAG TPA: alpha/beta hydrolase [Archangium sp.]|uniref:alpha/beta fold hydrolase n=1 Tax=Archangium sp. TaxID=1872627 RepID=UPI002E34B1D8|nr:alpha/beta hydrolase [Archangium sp.]HEX5751792.1 alpha/beta hydrolase [Archangium sp.]